MSINWVMLQDSGGFVPLPEERIVFSSPPRTSLSLKTPNTYPGKAPFSMQSSTGVAHLTNQRIIYLPGKPTPQFQSFAAPLLNLHDTHVTAPFFGPNVWSAALQPVPGGGIPPVQTVIEMTLTFKDGGAFDFQTYFERIQERLRQVIITARESGAMVGEGSTSGTGRGGGALAGVDLAAVHLDELPAYSAPGNSVPAYSGINHEAAPVPAVASPLVDVSDTTTSATQLHDTASGTANRRGTEDSSFTPPSEPPPGYEEAQQQSVASELESRLMRQ